MGAVESIIIKESKSIPNSASNNKFAFVEFKDIESVLFAVEMLDEILLFNRKITVAPRTNTEQVWLKKIFIFIILKLGLM